MRTALHKIATLGPEKVDGPLDPDRVAQLVQETVGRWASITGQWVVVQDLEHDVLVYDNGLTSAFAQHGEPATLECLRARIPEQERARVRHLQQVFRVTVEHCTPCRSGADCALTLTHRHRSPKGRFGRLQRHVLPLLWSSDGRVRAMLHLCREVGQLHGVHGAGAWSLTGPDALHEDFVARLKELGPDTWTPSARERELLQLMAQGLTSQVIATRLHRSLHTVNTHRRNMLRKAGVSNTTALVEQALKLGWV